MSRYLDLDYLKSLGIEPQYFGLGFIQLKLNDTERLHFWIDDGVVGEDEIHDHRYSFNSEILQGKIEHYTYTFEPALKGQWTKHLVSCDPNKPVPAHAPQRGHLTESSRYELAKGSWYHFRKGEFHQAYALPNTVTFVTRDEGKRAPFAHVIRPLGSEEVCPFSRTMTQDELWAKIAKIITYGKPVGNGPQKLENPGYHETHIAKGVLGEPSKIVEEAQEFLDATQQGVSIMAMVELSDMVGAIEAYLSKHHPTITFNDLIRMSDVTKRAFENGHRS